MTHSLSGIVFDAGVDYLTVTTTSKKSKPVMAERALKLLRSEEAAGFKLSPWTMMGFQGYKCGSMQVGEHDGRMIVRVSGEVSKSHWRPFAELHETCSRLDLQVTVRFDCDAMSAIARTYRQAKRNKNEDGKKRTVSLYSSSNGSATVYLGQRVTENYGRIYAKGLETKLPFWENSVRFEAEFKGEQAASELYRLLSSESERHHTVGRVRQWFSVRGVRPKWTTDGYLAQQAVGVIKTTTDGPRKPLRISDVERKLLWLQSSIRGPVQELIALGHRERVLIALGLQTEEAGDTSMAQLV